MLLKDATKFALRGQKRQRSEDSTAIYPVQINDDAFELQLVPSGSTDVVVHMDPLLVGENRYIMSLDITTGLYEELSKIELGISELVKEKHPNTAWKSSLVPPCNDFNYSAMLKVKFYDNLQVYDEQGEKIEAPKSWRRVRVIPIINLKAWVNDKGAGIWWNLAAVKITKPPPRAYTFV